MTKDNIQKGREILNDCLYKCMRNGSDTFPVPPLAIYIISIAVWDRSVRFFEHFIKKDWFPIPFGYFEGFKKKAERFGQPEFLEEENIAAFLKAFSENDRWMGECLVNLVRELRHIMRILADEPIMVDTGQYNKPPSVDEEH